MSHSPSSQRHPAACESLSKLRRHTGWVHIYEAFSRVVVLHAVLLHLTIVIGVDGVRWSSFCTVIITHALLKALRSAA